ncbi:glycosyltransferase family 2 protein [Mucilaginibacter flavus]|uniref:glycosyltransferase family 2 protein n=1 Tax=Mucilaginibacter flavus TaxID=931504 RepID=UPI0025B5EDCC|nr:glycosyltransferase family 2 protein [Mucilaginibacter flavus]MDN3584415.1 glycosyltransferase family 2 protein [Mucilaginibacter flavus]
MKPFFSIIIPLFNASSKLPQLLESVSLQRCRNFEVVFMDGASTDNTLDIVADFVKNNKKQPVIVHSSPDHGIYDAMNRGVDWASGEWLYFMGSDDSFCDAGVLEEVKDVLEREKADLIYGNVVGISGTTRYVYNTEDKVLSKGIHHQSVFYRHSLFDDFGKYDLKFPVAADYDFTLKVFLNDSYRIRYINRDIAYYGESGFSSVNFDYKFFCGHYRLLKCNKALDRIADPDKCLSDSVYCCYHLAGTKKNLALAWRNLLFYVFFVKKATLNFRIKVFYNMLKRTVRRPLLT